MLIGLFDDVNAGDAGSEPSDGGSEPSDASEATAGTEVDVDPGGTSIDPLGTIQQVTDGVDNAAAALGEAIGSIDWGEVADEVFNFLMNEP